MAFSRLFLRMRIFEALVELHLDIGAKQALDVHGAFRRQFMFAPIDMGLEDATSR